MIVTARRRSRSAFNTAYRLGFLYEIMSIEHATLSHLVKKIQFFSTLIDRILKIRHDHGRPSVGTLHHSNFGSEGVDVYVSMRTN